MTTPRDRQPRRRTRPRSITATSSTVGDRTRRRPGSVDPGDPALRATGPADLLTLIPYLLGYHPRESLVLALVSDDRVRMCARLDLVDAQQPEQLLGAVHALAAAQQASAVILVAFGTDRPRCFALLDRAMEELGAVRLAVVEAIYADGARWWSRACSGGCCPGAGHSL